MRVLYIDIVGLLYSQRYLESVKAPFDDLAFAMSYEPMSIIDSQPHDVVSARLLENAALDANLKIYPVEPFRSYRWVRDREFFNPSSLAPDIDWEGRLRMGNSGTTARMLIHAETLGITQWWCCGGSKLNWQLPHLQNRYLKSPTDRGITPQLLSRIRAL